jgi:SpoVK/Ycf46/Vps4 family AAA+-type ATPase
MENVDFDSLGKRTDKYSGADLKALVDMVVEAKIAAAMKEGVPTPILTRDFDRPLKTVKPSTNEWFSSARNYAVYANEGGLYDDILKYLKI